jgi:CHAT domain-containing protein/Tfp pilus assembly protein PilF
MLGTGCRKKSQEVPSPDALYHEIDGQFVAGELLQAEHAAAAAEVSYAQTNPIWGARFRIELAKIRLYQGRSKDSIELLQRSLPSGVENSTLIEQNLLMSMAQARLGDSILSEQALAKAEALHPDGTLLVELLGIKGSVAIERGRLDEAEHFFQTALDKALRENAKFLQAQMLLNLGVVALPKEHYEDALDRFTRASVLARSVGAKLWLEKALGSLGWTYYRTGDFERALINMKTTAVQAEAIGASLDQVRALHNIGMIEFRLNNLAAARSSYERSLQLAESIQNPEEILGAHVALGYLLLHVEAKAAEAHILEASRLAKLRQNDTEELEPLLLEALLLIEQNKKSAAEEKLHTLVKRAGSSPWMQWEAESTLARLYATTGRDKLAHLWFQCTIDTFHRQRLSLKSVELQLPFLENGNALYLDYMEHLLREGRKDDALKILDQSRAETLAEGLGTKSAGGKGSSASLSSARALAARLHGTILVYCLRPQVSYLWAINAAREESYTLPGSATILPLVASHTQSILASKDLLAQKESTGRALYDALVKPAAGLIGHDSRVFLIGDKELSGLNFETLIPPGEQPHYWIEDVTITNANSLRLLAALGKEPRQPALPKILLIGDPVYRTADYAALPNASTEMASVAAHFTPEHRSVIAGSNASPSAYPSSAPGQFSYIHFVAHATANETNPLDSAIILSSPAGQPEGYKLYARDILDQPLHAELVTISSCYGSGLRNYSGEGLVGLAWAFLRAGSHYVIGAMWEVSDASTPQLMDHLYDELAHGRRPDAALRSAKLSLIRGGGAFRKPLYWAPFQLYSGS